MRAALLNSPSRHSRVITRYGSPADGVSQSNSRKGGAGAASSLPLHSGLTSSVVCFIQGGVDDELSLTAYITTALLEAGLPSSVRIPSLWLSCCNWFQLIGLAPESAANCLSAGSDGPQGHVCMECLFALVAVNKEKRLYTTPCLQAEIPLPAMSSACVGVGQYMAQRNFLVNEMLDIPANSPGTFPCILSPPKTWVTRDKEKAQGKPMKHADGPVNSCISD